MIVPLNARGRTLGALTLAATDDSGRRFGAEDLKMAIELARRAALLIDNARLYAEARSAIRARDDMIAIVSHDLRDPLQTITAAAATLLFESVDDDKAESVRRISLASTQMRRLVQDLLDLSRIEAGQLSIANLELAINRCHLSVARMVAGQRNGAHRDADGGLRMAMDIRLLRSRKRLSRDSVRLRSVWIIGVRHL
jgi:K+-sensing histidine kinase KdpD